MVMQNALSKPPNTSTIKPEVNLNSIWYTLDETDYDSGLCTTSGNNYDSCRMLRECQTDLDRERDRNVLPMSGSDSSTRRQFVSVKPALYAGILIGTVLGGCIVYVVMIVLSACAKRQTKRRQQHRLRRTYVIRGDREGTA